MLSLKTELLPNFGQAPNDTKETGALGDKTIEVTDNRDVTNNDDEDIIRKESTFKQLYLTK